MENAWRSMFKKFTLLPRTTPNRLFYEIGGNLKERLENRRKKLEEKYEERFKGKKIWQEEKEVNFQTIGACPKILLTLLKTMYNRCCKEHGHVMS